MSEVGKLHTIAYGRTYIERRFRVELHRIVKRFVELHLLNDCKGRRLVVHKGGSKVDGCETNAPRSDGGNRARTELRSPTQSQDRCPNFGEIPEDLVQRFR